VCLGALAALPIVRASDSLQLVEVRLAGVGLLALLAALVLGWTPWIPAAIVIVGADYAAELAIDDARLDSSAPAFAAGLLVTAELAYWSLEERDHVRGEAGAGLRHAAFVAGLGVTTLVVASALLALVDAVHTRGLAIDLLGAAAAAAALFAIVLAARGHGRTGH
jgi:hypothetical protein